MTKEMFFARVTLALLAVCALGFAAGFIFQSPVVVIGSVLLLFFILLSMSTKNESLDHLKRQVDTLNRQQLEELDDYIDAKLIKQESK